MKYNAFISFSHEADDKFAPSLQHALQKFAKPWYKKRSLEIFRDESSLSASPHLWENITRALDDSEYLILLASPASEKSVWVNQEVEYWLKNKPDPLETLLIALTDGNMDWDHANKCFKDPDHNSLPDILDHKFNSMPFYIDMRQSKEDKDLSLDNPIFKKEILKLAAKLHGMAPNDLASEEVSMHRRTIRIRNSAISMLVLLFFTAVAAAWYANQQAIEANLEKRKAQSNYLRSEAKSALPEDPTLALRLYEQAIILYRDSIKEKEASDIYTNSLFYKIVVRDSSFIDLDAGDHPRADFSPDGKTILTSSDNGCIRLWNLEGNKIKELNNQDAFVNSFAFSPDGEIILTGCSDGTVRLWDLSGNSFRVIIHEGRSVNSAVFSPDGKTILTSCSEGTVRLWDLMGNCMREFIMDDFFIGESILHAAFSIDGQTIIIYFREGPYIVVQLRNLQGNIILERNYYSVNEKSVYPFAFSPDGKKMLIGEGWRGSDNVKLWDLVGNTFKEFHEAREYDSTYLASQDDQWYRKILRAAFSPDGKTILTGSYDGIVRLRDLSGITIWECKGHDDQVFSVDFSKDGKAVLTSSRDGTARVWDISKKKFGGSFGLTFTNRIHAVSFVPDGDTILVAYSHHYYGEIAVRILDLAGDSIREFQIINSDLSLSSAFSPDGKAILNETYGIATLLDSGGNCIREYKHDNRQPNEPLGLSGVRSVVFSPDGKSILTGHAYMSDAERSGGIAKLWDLWGNTIREFKGHTGEVNAVVFAKDGKAILTGSADSTSRLWDLNGNAVSKFKGHKSGVTSVDFAPDGKTILTGSSDSTARLWDLAGKTISEFKGHTSGVTSVAFSPDGKTILTGSGRGTAILWDLAGNAIWRNSSRDYEYPFASNESPGRPGDRETLVAFSRDGNKMLIVSAGDDYGSSATVRLCYIPLLMENLQNNDKIEPLSVEQKKIYGIELIPFPFPMMERRYSLALGDVRDE